MFGRHEKELVTGWLTETSDQNAEILVSTDHVSVVSIVGHGGKGITTLAQLICKVDGVINHFEKVLWACVSTIFDAKTIIGTILESYTLAKPTASSLEALLKILRKELKSVKFLLVLDDVWEDSENEQWQKLFAPLREGKSGSKKFADNSDAFCGRFCYQFNRR